MYTYLHFFKGLLEVTRAGMFWLPRYLFILVQNEYIHKQNIKVYYVNVSTLANQYYKLQVIFFIGVTMMIVTKR